MATTAIFVEILIVGLQSSVWLILLAIALFGIPSALIPLLTAFKDWSGLATVFVLCFAYSFGIVMDRLSDLALNPLLNGVTALLSRWMNRWNAKGSESRYHPLIPKMRLRLLTEKDGAGPFFEYLRSRLRIVRSTVLNLCLIMATLIPAISRLPCPDGALLRIELMLGILLVATTVAWVSIDRNYIRRLTQACEVLAEKEENARSKENA